MRDTLHLSSLLFLGGLVLPVGNHLRDLFPPSNDINTFASTTVFLHLTAFVVNIFIGIHLLLGVRGLVLLST